ncbi:MAG: hypothetical protein ACLUFF_01220 [Acutalibacteraceae bacterium]
MKPLIFPTEVNAEKLKRGCLLACIAHAIVVVQDPEFSYEHSWDGMSYSTIVGAQRGTVTFYQDGSCIAAFRNERSERLDNFVRAESYFQDAPAPIYQMANEEVLQYLLDDTEEGIKPLITTAFWGKDEMFSNDSYEEMMDNGGDLLTYQVMDLEDACDGWKEFYDMTEEQIELLKELYWQRIEQLDVPMKLTKEQIKRMGKPSWGGKKESKESFAEIGIQW